MADLTGLSLSGCVFWLGFFSRRRHKCYSVAEAVEDAAKMLGEI
jgi:hypothetical protein